MSEVLNKRQLQAKSTKEKLFRAAYSLLEEEPFENITIREIVQRAGVSVGTFYTYYPSKMDVFYETYQLSDDYFAGEVAEALQAEPNACQRMLLLFDHYARYVSEITSIKLSKLLYNAENKAFNRPANEIANRVEECLRYGVQQGEFDLRGASFQRLTRFFMMSARGLHYDWCIHDGGYDLRTATADYIGILLNTVRTEPMTNEFWRDQT